MESSLLITLLFTIFIISITLLIIINRTILKNLFITYLNPIIYLLDWKTLWKAFLDLLLIALFTMLSSIITIISLLVKSNGNIKWELLYDKGNFFLYAISLFSTSLVYYLHKKDRVTGKYLVMILMILCAITFTNFSDGQKSTTDFTKFGSLVAIFISALTLIITQYYQHLILLDLSEEDNSNQNRLNKIIKY
tara:strand:- start:6277 stop:6855 length:579 start_codon:yes stop_codon:yes gene_type:complete